MAGLSLGDGPFVFETLEQRDIRVVVMAKGLVRPRSLAFLPDGAILVTEQAGRLRIVRDGVLAPEPIAGVPAVVSRGSMPGLESIALHLNFAENRWIYISYHTPLYGNLGNIAIMRGTWDGRALTDVRDPFVSDDVDTGVPARLRARWHALHEDRRAGHWTGDFADPDAKIAATMPVK